MFTPKLIVTDLDGTALNNNKEITAETIKAFERCRKKGIHIAIATARYIVGASYYARKLHADFQILTDGTLVYENGRLVYSRIGFQPTLLTMPLPASMQPQTAKKLKINLLTI